MHISRQTDSLEQVVREDDSLFAPWHHAGTAKGLVNGVHACTFVYHGRTTCMVTVQLPAYRA